MNSDQESITRLLQEWSNGDKMALDQLMPLVYEQLHKLAMRCMRSERQDHTLRATALVHEAYVRLVKANVSFKDRAFALRCSSSSRYARGISPSKKYGPRSHDSPLPPSQPLVGPTSGQASSRCPLRPLA
jgi:hypothetical protein